MRVTAVLILALLACVPTPATLEPAPTEVAESPPPTSPASPPCYALLGEATQSGDFVTRELRWDASGVEEREHPGLILGDAEGLFLVEIEIDRDPANPHFPQVGADCEEQRLTARKLPDGVAQPLSYAMAVCVGEDEGRYFESIAAMEILSGLGPYLGYHDWYEHIVPPLPQVVDYGTIDLRTGKHVRADQSREAIDALARAELLRRESEGTLDLSECKEARAEKSPWWVQDFAVDLSGSGGPRLRIAFTCCRHKLCELEVPLAQTHPELAARLPDPDGLFHSPYGCGSIGLDGQLRTRDGAKVGSGARDGRRTVGVVFLPADHPVELDW